MGDTLYRVTMQLPNLALRITNAPPKRARTIAAVGSILATVAVTVASAISPSGNSTRALDSVVVVLVLAAGWYAPVSSTASYGVLLQLAASNMDLRGPLVVVGAISLALIIALRVPPKISGACVALLWYLIQVDLTEGDFIPSELDTAVFVGLMFATAWAGGTALRNTVLTRVRDSEQFQQRLEEERERTVKALHGSVASSLTSVVLRSEALAMASSGPAADTAQLIAEDARRAMQEVRALIRFMRGDDPELDVTPIAETETQLISAFQHLGADLRTFGFTVIETGLSEDVLGNIHLAHISSVCREMHTNILKYADTAHPVIVAAIRDGDTITVAVQNTIAPHRRNVHMATGIGLEDAGALVKQDGAQLAYSYVGDQWRYELVVPRVFYANH